VGEMSRLGPALPSRPSEAQAGKESRSPTNVFKARNGVTDLGTVQAQLWLVNHGAAVVTEHIN
jgi:hypothetical protein